MAIDPDQAAAAAADRAAAAADRTEAAAELAEAVRLRTQAADELKHTTTDELTGALARTFGLAEASRELARASRTGVGLTLVFVDVDGLKQVNDSRGHAAGDALLRLVGETLRAHLRPYDVIVRYGGDEFVCVMPDLRAVEATERFDKVSDVLREVGVKHSITFGIAGAVAGQSLEALIARADTDLLEARQLRRRRRILPPASTPTSPWSLSARAARTRWSGCGRLIHRAGDHGSITGRNAWP